MGDLIPTQRMLVAVIANVAIYDHTQGEWGGRVHDK
jgi:hypothetical protein